jgi:hypothetical protein
MSIYRCYFHNKHGVTENWQAIYGENEAEARLTALDVLRERGHVGKLEVWRDGLRIFELGRESLNAN